MIKYPSTEQFRSIVKSVSEEAQFVKYDEEKKEVIWNKDAILPTIKFHGTVKLHGTQGAIVQNSNGNIHFQSRKNIVTPEKDNAGFAFFCESRKNIFENYFKELRNRFSNGYISIYGEYCGGNIQKGVAINGLPKMFVIFAIKITPKDEEDSFWIENTLRSNPENNIYTIEDFQTYEIEIDFNDKVKLAEAQNEMIRLTTLVGDQCPVGKYFGNTGIGEGIVWSNLNNGKRIIFKTKDNRHSKSKVKVPKIQNVEEQKNIQLFVNNYACTDSRMTQMFTEIVHSVHNGNEELMSMKDMGSYIKLVHQDVIKEELDKLNELNLEPKAVNSSISRVARTFFISKLDEIAGM